MAYAVGKKALGQCDRCGFSYKLNTLQYQIEDGKRNGLRVCYDCLDEDQPQLKIGEVNTNDPQNLYNARVDTGKTNSTSYSANSALVLRDYLTSSLGMNISSTEIDDTSFITAANVCDEDVTLADGSSEKRYEANGMIDTAVEPVSIINGDVAASGLEDGDLFKDMATCSAFKAI